MALSSIQQWRQFNLVQGQPKIWIYIIVILIFVRLANLANLSVNLAWPLPRLQFWRQHYIREEFGTAEFPCESWLLDRNSTTGGHPSGLNAFKLILKVE